MLIADVTKKILVECLIKYKYTRDSKKTKVTFIANEVAKNKIIVETFAKGLCCAYVVVLNIKPLDDNAFTITNYG